MELQVYFCNIITGRRTGAPVPRPASASGPVSLVPWRSSHCSDAGSSAAIDLAAERAGGPARPVRRQQRRRQQRVAQHHPAVMVDQQDPRGEGVDIRQPFAAADPAPQRLEGFHELQIGVGGAIAAASFR